MRIQFMIGGLAAGFLATCGKAERAAPADTVAEKMAEPQPVMAPPPAAAGAAARDRALSNILGSVSGGGTAALNLATADDLFAEAAAAPEPAPKATRMVHYNGHLKLKVTNPAQTLQRAAEVADAAGGYVETLSSASVTLRVPVAVFRDVFARLSKLGDVLSRSLTAADVTDAFVAVDLRAKTLRASRDRLMALLPHVTQVREKLSLLAEIRRLTEEIDQLDLQLTTLASLADLSRITVEVAPHQVEVHAGGEEPIAAFRWIHTLSPFRRDVAQAGDQLKLEVPAGLVALSDREHWIAESADGAVIWSGRRDNLPRGSTDFWAQAVRDRLGRDYGSAELIDMGSFKVVRLVDQSEKGYRYLVAVRARGGDLDVIEVYYPSEEQEKRYADVVRATIERGET